MLSLMGALIHTDPENAKQRIRDALIAAKGDRNEAAKAFGLTSPRSLYRWIERLGMWPEVDALMSEHGFAMLPGPPRTRAKILAAIVKTGGDRARAARHLGVKLATLERRIETLNLEGDVVRMTQTEGAGSAEAEAEGASNG